MRTILSCKISILVYPSLFGALSNHNINTTSGKIGNFKIIDNHLKIEGNGYVTGNSQKSYIAEITKDAISFSDTKNCIRLSKSDNLSGTGRSFLELYGQPDSYNPIVHGININLKESGGFNGIFCKIEKSGGVGTAKGIVIETTNPKDDVALEATGRVRLYNVRDIANENAIYNLQLYAQSAGNGNFYIMGKSV